MHVLPNLYAKEQMNMFKNLSALKERAKSLMNELTKAVQDFDVQYTDEINNRYDVNLDEILDTMERKIREAESAAELLYYSLHDYETERKQYVKEKEARA